VCSKERVDSRIENSLATCGIGNAGTDRSDPTYQIDPTVSVIGEICSEGGEIAYLQQLTAGLKDEQVEITIWVKV
jgi:hypothetical protein